MHASMHPAGFQTTHLREWVKWALTLIANMILNLPFGVGSPPECPNLYWLLYTVCAFMHMLFSLLRCNKFSAPKTNVAVNATVNFDEICRGTQFQWRYPHSPSKSTAYLPQWYTKWYFRHRQSIQSVFRAGEHWHTELCYGHVCIWHYDMKFTNCVQTTECFSSASRLFLCIIEHAKMLSKFGINVCFIVGFIRYTKLNQQLIQYCFACLTRPIMGEILLPNYKVTCQLMCSIIQRNLLSELNSSCL